MRLAMDDTGQIGEMEMPVRCGECNSVYDLASVEVLDREPDFTTFKTGCCGTVRDDTEWEFVADYNGGLWNGRDIGMNGPGTE